MLKMNLMLFVKEIVTPKVDMEASKTETEFGPAKSVGILAKMNKTIRKGCQALHVWMLQIDTLRDS